MSFSSHRNNSINQKIYERNIPSHNLQPYLNVRPVMTKYSILPIVDPRKDVSKLIPNKPVTSDELLYEISSIKEQVVKQLTQLIKETSFDCGIYSHGKEKIMCMNFSNPNQTDFSYNPDYLKEQRDTILKTNVNRVEWTGKIVILDKIKYIARQMSPNSFEIYDMNSYNRAKINPNEIIIKVGNLNIVNGKQVFTLI